MAYETSITSQHGEKVAEGGAGAERALLGKCGESQIHKGQLR